MEMTQQMVTEFIKHTGSTQTDAISCLNTWGWDLKKALIDYNDTSTTEYFKTNDLNSMESPVHPHPLSSSSSSSLHYSPPQLKQYDIRTSNSKPTLTKTDSIDLVDFKKFARGISRATDNVNLVSRARSEFAMDFHSNYVHGKNLDQLYFIDTPDYTFTLPDLTKYSEDFRKFLEKDLIECSTLSSLEQAQRLNWWVDSGTCRKLWPLATTGDGNCLLHAASLGMWGFHDRRLTLRKALHAILSKDEYRNALWRRWRFQQTRLNKQAGFVYSELEWEKEWEEIVAIASPEPRQNNSKSANSRRRSVIIDKNNHTNNSDLNEGIGGADENLATYESLEEIHVLALAHVLRRTIIVVSDIVLRDMNGEAMAPIPFGGVYLPFEIESHECHRAPLLLTYDMAHFSALVAMENSCGTSDYPPALMPLTDSENVLLPIQFCIDPGKDFIWSEYDGSDGSWALTDREHIALLKEYMDIVFASPPGSPDDEIYEDFSDEDYYDKKVSDAEIVFADDAANEFGSSSNNSTSSTAKLITGNSKNSTSSNSSSNSSGSKAAKQIQSVAKQFGSIGKSMSKKLKKNIGSITKIGKNKNALPSNMMPTSNSTTYSFNGGKFRILCAHLRPKRHEYQEEMIKNYLDCAYERYLELERQQQQVLLAEHQNKRKTSLEAVNCVNTGCLNYGTAKTSYMCVGCYEKQKQREINCTFSDPLSCSPTQTLRYGTGNSKFYTQSDIESHNRIKRLPSVRRLNELDQTLYLSKSTFYNDKRVNNNYDYEDDDDHVLNQVSSSNASSSIPTVTGTSSSQLLKENLIEIEKANIALHMNPHNSSTIMGTSKAYAPVNNLPYSRNTMPMCVNLPPLSAPAAKETPTSTTATTYTSKIVHNIPITLELDNNESIIVNNNNNNNINANTNHENSKDNTDLILYNNNNNNDNMIHNKICKTFGCKFYGNVNTNFYCSKCCQEQLQLQRKSQPPQRVRYNKILSDV